MLHCVLFALNDKASHSYSIRVHSNRKITIKIMWKITVEILLMRRKRKKLGIGKQNVCKNNDDKKKALESGEGKSLKTESNSSREHFLK